MAGIAQGQSSDCSNPILDIFISVNGVMTDITGTLAFAVFDISDAAKQLTPVQVYPVAGTQPVDLDPCVDGGAKISTGRYVAKYTASLAPPEPTGTHRIEWYYRLTNDSPEQKFCEEFEVLSAAAASSGQGYCLVSELRAEGLSAEMYPDEWVTQRIVYATRYIERVTHQKFEPYTATFDLDGRGGKHLALQIPVIAVSAITVFGEDVDLGSVAIYNRHLTQNLIAPDDRDAPKISFRSSGFGNYHTHSHGHYATWSKGEQNVSVSGVFGYTDYDPSSAMGVTPPLVRRAACLLVLRDVDAMASAKRTEALVRARIIGEKTRDQSYNLESLASSGRIGRLTGDPEIDQILAMYQRPTSLGSA